MKKIFPFFLYALIGVVRGFGGIRSINWYHHYNKVKIFAEKNVYSGNFYSLVQDIGHGEPIMVTLEGCPHCNDARAWMKPRNIKVVEVPINTNAKINKVMRANNIWGTPTLITSKKIVYGFQADVWASVLN